MLSQNRIPTLVYINFMIRDLQRRSSYQGFVSDTVARSLIGKPTGPATIVRTKASAIRALDRAAAPDDDLEEVLLSAQLVSSMEAQMPTTSSKSLDSTRVMSVESVCRTVQRVYEEKNTCLL